MSFLSLDNCVWLRLINIELYAPEGIFQEICFWIENRHVIHIVPENVLREWDRTKVNRLTEVVNSNVAALEKSVGESFNGTPDLVSSNKREIVESIVQGRITRIDNILKSYSELAKENDVVIKNAAIRNLNCIPPNHTKDSYRDTINILTLLNHIKEKNYSSCVFSTLNYDDFSQSKSEKHTYHSGLSEVFNGTGLEYIYCDEKPFAGKLLQKLRTELPSYQDFLREKKRKAEELELLERKAASNAKIESTDKEYLENIKHLDLILTKGTVTAMEEQFLKLLFDTHQSYKDYFFNRIGS